MPQSQDSTSQPIKKPDTSPYHLAKRALPVVVLATFLVWGWMLWALVHVDDLVVQP